MASSQNTDLVEIIETRPGYFKERKFLSIDEIYEHLQSHQAGSDMMYIIQRVKSHIFSSYVLEFPVTGLRHTTNLNPLEKILESQSFMGRNPETAPKESELRPEFMDLSFWTADISSSDIEKAREAAYTYLEEHHPHQLEGDRAQIMRHLASSPAFQRSSPYGNCTFSLTFSDLLSLYGDQFCNRKKPQLSILGTDVYRYEIAHYVVVHSPDEERFKDLPRVPILQTREKPLPCVYWMRDTLYWRPQSTTNNLNETIRRDNVVLAWSNFLCPWNQLTFAFHIPCGRALQIQEGTLIDSLSSCEILEPFLKTERWRKGKAEAFVKEVKEEYRESQDSE